MDKMNVGAGRTDNRGVFTFCILWWVRQPMLHVHAGLGALEYDRTTHASSISRFAGTPYSVSLRRPSVVVAGAPIRAALMAADIAFCVRLFLVGEIVLSRILYRAHLRDEPY